jgi:hypothetical protein
VQLTGVDGDQGSQEIQAGGEAVRALLFFVPPNTLERRTAEIGYGTYDGAVSTDHLRSMIMLFLYWLNRESDRIAYARS